MRKDFEDDGRTVADMSGIERQPLFIPHFNKSSEKKQTEEINADDRPWENNEFSGKEKRSFIAGALGATMLIATLFIVAAAVVILLITKLGA